MVRTLARTHGFFAGGLGLFLAVSAAPLGAQMSPGSHGSMEGMEGESSPPPPAPKPAPAKPAPAPHADKEAHDAPEAEKAAPHGATPAEDGHASEAGHGEEGKGMTEPPPSSMDGRLLLTVFAILNAAILAVAAVLKFRRPPATTSREVKA